MSLPLLCAFFGRRLCPTPERASPAREPDSSSAKITYCAYYKLAYFIRNKVLGHAATVDQTRIWLYYRGRSPFFEDLYRSARPPVRHLAGTVGRAESHRPARGPEAVGTRRPARPAADQPDPLARSARRQ